MSEGNVGGGTGMMCLGFKGGIGTASRIIRVDNIDYTVGVLVQSNFGTRTNLTISGVHVGKELMDTLQTEFHASPKSYRQEGDGSIIAIVATDAPLLPHQLKRIAQRVSLGIGLVGGRASNGSGDIFLAFSTANEQAFDRDGATTVAVFSNDQMTPLFDATVQGVEEAIINALVAAKTMSGVNGNKVYGLPHKSVVEILKKYQRIQ